MAMLNMSELDGAVCRCDEINAKAEPDSGTWGCHNSEIDCALCQATCTCVDVYRSDHRSKCPCLDTRAP
jgi:hypothetical protein